MGELIAVLSGKGGTGKTSVCAGVASALADTGAKVLCIDCDMGLRNLDISLGLANLSALSFMDILRGDYGLIQALRHPACETLYFLTAPLDCTADQVDPELFRQMLSHARQGFDYVFLDAPAGWTPVFSWRPGLRTGFCWSAGRIRPPFGMRPQPVSIWS